MTINTTTAASLFIDGLWVASEDGCSLEIRNPADGSVMGTIGYGSKVEALAAVDAAQKAFASWANTTEMGLAAYFYTGQLGRAWRVAEALEAGILGLKSALPSAGYAALGGVKQSGLGREGSHHGLEEFQQIKYVCTEL